jgi:hypothetical protein
VTFVSIATNAYFRKPGSGPLPTSVLPNLSMLGNPITLQIETSRRVPRQSAR